MAEKEAKEERPSAAPPADSAAKDGKKAAKGGLLKSTPAMLVIIMFLEAVVLFAGFKFLGSSPKHAEAVTPDSEVVDGGAAPAGGHGDAAATGGGGGAHGNSKQVVEIPVLSFKAPNRVSGVTYLYEVEIVATTKSANKDKVTASIEGRTATIKDRVRTIISQTEPAKLGGGSEPGLETLRRQIKFQLDEIVGPHMIEEVLIPRCIPYRADY